MSEGAAFRRITAARLVRRFPSVLGHLERGDVHLSVLVLLRDHLTESNVDELLAAASRRTKREVEELLARRAPRPDVPGTIRKLPAARVRSEANLEEAEPSENGEQRTDGVAVKKEAGEERRGEDASKGSTDSCELDAADVASQSDVASQTQSRSRSPECFEATRPPSVSASSSRSRGRLEPLSEARHRLQLTISTAARQKLERARDLMRHRNPSGDLEAIVEHALDALLDKLEKERLGKTTKTGRGPRVAKAKDVTCETRREVFERDGEQCTFEDEKGRRCPSRGFLELDHIEARARGGSNEASNLRVRCRAHNNLHAENIFGRELIRVRTHFRQRKRAGGAPLRVGRRSDEGGEATPTLSPAKV